MTTTLRAHFDGKVLVPEGPVDLPVGQSIELVVKESPTTARPDEKGPLARLADFVESLPPVEGDVPTDLAAQIDHYLYGTPKRP